MADPDGLGQTILFHTEGFMDFGKILDNWESRQKKPASPSKEPEKTDGGVQINPIKAWLQTNEVYDKDREEEDSVSPSERRRQLHAKRPDAELDLHGLTKDEAWASLDDFFSQSHAHGFTKILIIHGKGNHSDGDGILRALVKRYIEICPYAGESGHSPAKTGGTGSTWVLLKKARNS